MFNDNYFGTEDSSIFHGIVASKRFNQLEYKEFDKTKINLIKPYRQFEKSQEKVETDEEYTLLNFSRVCFDDKRENGIIVIEYRKGFSHGSMSGYNMALLIKKIDDKWAYIPRR